MPVKKKPCMNLILISNVHVFTVVLLILVVGSQDPLCFLGFCFPFPFEASRSEERVLAAGGVVSMSALKMKIATVNRIVIFQRYL